MLLSQEEARNKWCPHTDPDGDLQGYCIGDRCMAWAQLHEDGIGCCSLTNEIVAIAINSQTKEISKPLLMHEGPDLEAESRITRI